MGEPEKGMTIDRINNNLGYSKQNCRWVSGEVQHRNTRANVMIEHLGATRCVSEWARVFGFDPETFRQRLRKTSFEEAIANPLKKRKHDSKKTK